MRLKWPGAPLSRRRSPPSSWPRSRYNPEIKRARAPKSREVPQDCRKEGLMLILTRRVAETVMIGDEVTIAVLGVKGN